MGASFSSSASGKKRRATDDESSLLSSKRQKLSSPASASGGNSRWKYDVFLSFRGEDTRNNFTGHLYGALNWKGFFTFIDDERLERGAEISSELTRAIEESRISIVIFSKNYASSTWCLEELAKIVECSVETNNNHTVIPVFYNVDPSHVRKQEGEFKKAFDKHQKNPMIDSDKILRWRAALIRAANTAGYDISAGRSEVTLLEDIVNDISRRLEINARSKYVFGRDHHWEKMNELLQVESDGVRFVGICGMGGIGKTTIARYVYDNLSNRYEVSCFLGDVRQVCERSGGRVIALQEQLLSKVMKQTIIVSNVDDGIGLIRRYLGRKKVLIVLDDVDDQLEQLNKLAGRHDWFGPESRIIVTTRDEQVLKSHEITYIYKVGVLNDGDALRLFHMNAFKKKAPTDNHVNLSMHIVNYAHGLPLALEVLGSHLCDTTVEHWKSTLDSLRDNPNGKILKVLRINYDGLQKNEKDIFLDIACFFQGKNKDRVMKILDSCDLHSASGIKVLVDKSLVTISNNDKLCMHDLLQEMGWEIVRENYPNAPSKWSRLWLSKDVQHLLKGTDEVKGIMLNKPKEQILRLNGKSFSSMSKLQLLKISNVRVKGQINLSNNLRFFKWYGCPLKNLPSNFEAQNLFELNLCRSQIKYLWTGKKAFLKLKTIKLCNSLNLIETPDFSMVPNLELLDLKGCIKLSKLHKSVRVLESLIELNLEGCNSFESFPSKVFSGLKLLQILNLQGCNSLQSFPSDVSGLKSLQILNLQGCNSLQSFPSNVSGLKSLKNLNLHGCSKLDKLPENLGELEGLEELYVGGTAIEKVPSSSIAKLKNLKILSSNFRNWKIYA